MANTITSDYFLALFDEFSSVNIAKIDTFIGIASLRVSPSVWGPVAPYATALLTAHMISSSGGAGGSGGAAGGAISSESVGQLSRSYSQVAQAGSGDAGLETTRYGIEFVALRRETIASAVVTGPLLYPPKGGADNLG